MPKGIIYAMLAAFCFGIMPILTKILYGETGVDPFFFLMIRYTIAAVILWSYLLIWQEDLARAKIDRQGIVLVLLTSICYIGVTSMYFIALKYIDASLNSLLVFTFPIFTPLLGFLFFKEKLVWFQVITALVGFIGCLLLVGNYQLKGLPGETIGIGLGLLSGLIYSLYSLFGQKITLTLKPVMVTALNVALVAGFFIICRLHWLWLHPQPVSVYVVAGIVGIVSTILANVFYFEAIRAVGAVKAGIFSSLEPIFTTGLAIWLLQERIALMQWIGVALIIGVIIMMQFEGFVKETKPEGIDQQ